MRLTSPFLAALVLAGCTSVDEIGRPPSFTPLMEGREHSAMFSPGLPEAVERRSVLDSSSLWRGDRKSLLGDRRALRRGDIMTVVIEIDDKAEISNSTSRSRNGSEDVSIPNFQLRELLVSGYVRPADISRQNEITYDKIASAKVSYGGRGQITDVQQPRYGQQILDAVLPF